MVHFTHTDDISGEKVEAVLIAAFLAELELGAGVFAGDGRDGCEEEVGAVGHPVYPFEFAEIGFAAVNIDAGTEVGVIGGVFWEEEFCSWDLEECFFDGIELCVSECFVALNVRHNEETGTVRRHSRSITNDICPSRVWKRSHRFSRLGWCLGRHNRRLCFHRRQLLGGHDANGGSLR